MTYTFTVRLSVDKLSVHHITLLGGQFSLAVRLVVLPLSCIGIAVLPNQRALSLLGTKCQLARIFITIGIFEDTCATALTAIIVTFIDVAVLETIDAFAMHQITLEQTNIDIAISILIDTLARLQVILPLTIVTAAVSPLKTATTAFLVVLPFAIVPCTFSKGITPTTVTLVFTPVAVVFVAIEVVHHAVTLLHIAIPQTNVFVVVRKIESSFAMLLILHPLTFIFFTVGKGIDTIPLTLAFYILALEHVAIFPCGATLSMWLARRHFPFIFTIVLRCA